MRDKIVIYAKMIANSYHDLEAFRKGLREFFDLGPSDIEIRFRVDAPIEKASYDWIYGIKAHHGNVTDINKYKKYTSIANSFSGWIRFSEFNASIETVDNSTLDSGEMPIYEEYLETKKTIFVRDIIKSDEFRNGLETAIISAAEEKEKKWFTEYVDALNRIYKNHYGRYPDESEIEACLKADYPSIAYR